MARYAGAQRKHAETAKVRRVGPSLAGVTGPTDPCHRPPRQTRTPNSMQRPTRNARYFCGSISHSPSQPQHERLHDPMHAYSVYWSHVYYCITPTTASPHTVIAHACHHPNSCDAPQVYSDGMPACKFNTCRGAPCVGCRVITVITAITSHAMFAHHASHAVQC